MAAYNSFKAEVEKRGEQLKAAKSEAGAGETYEGETA